MSQPTSIVQESANPLKKAAAAVKNLLTSFDESNADFKKALHLIEETDTNVFITGYAGTGKSTLLKKLLAREKKNYVVVAPTGIAAVNVAGETIHRVFKLPIRPLLPEDPDIKKFYDHSAPRELLRELDTLVIDEVSMVRVDIMNAIDRSLRLNTGKDIPFGGKQLVMFGDLYQLEPVIHEAKELLTEYYESNYFFFDAPVFQQVRYTKIELKKVYRQREQALINILNKIRDNSISQEEITLLNENCYNSQKLDLDDFEITLTTTNARADAVNSLKLAAIRSQSYFFEGITENYFPDSKLPVERKLELKLGAQVMFVRNDVHDNWVNGTIGTVEDLTEKDVSVRLQDNTIHKVEKCTWENIEYRYDWRARKVVSEIKGIFTQFPLRLAWAVTIHKSQGLSFDKVKVDLGSNTFACGQAYVALSRCRKLSGLKLVRPLRKEDIKTHPRVVEFMQ